MKSSKPPTLATWLVEHMVRGGKNEALAGDLLEQFNRGRSARWYWSQVISAIIVGWSKEFRTWGPALGITVVWTSALSLFFGRFWFDGEWIALNRIFMRHDWDWMGTASYSMFSPCFLSLAAFNLLPIALATSMCLGQARVSTVRRFLRGLFAGFLVMTISFFLQSYLEADLYINHIVLPRFVWELLLSFLLFFVLLVSMWAARPNHDGRANIGIALP